MADPIKTIEQAADIALAEKYIPMLVAMITSLFTGWFAWVGTIIGYAVSYQLKRVGHAVIIELGNKFIGLRKAGEAAAAGQSGQELKQVLDNPNATKEELDNANKKFDDDYAKLITIHH